MGADFIIQGVSPTVTPLGYADYPVQASLRDLFWLGTDAAASRDNQVSGRSDATVTGLANAVVTASIAANVMTVTALTSGAVWLGMDIGGGRRVVSLGTGTGGTGTYGVSPGADVASATITGTPYHDGYASFGGSLVSNRITMATNENEFSERTYVAVCRHLGPLATSSDWRAAIGNYGGTANGMALFQNVATMGNGGLRSAGIGVPTPPQSQFHFIALTYTAADKTLRTYYGRDGALYASGSYSDATGNVVAGVPILIGSNSTIGTNQRVLDLAMAAQHNAPLTLADLQKVYTYARDYLVSGHGLDVA